MSANENTQAEPPYGVIANYLKRGQIIPFLGAGVNMGMSRSSLSLPSGSMLSRELAAQSSFPSKEEYELNDLAKVASYYAETVGRGPLRDSLHTVFDKEYALCRVHEYLADLPEPLLIVTTNYDDLMERAFKAKGRPYDLVVHATDRGADAAAVLWWQHGQISPEACAPNNLPMTERLQTTTVIYKMHGMVVRPWHKGKKPEELKGEPRPYRDDSYVITEEDYVDFLHRMISQAAVPAQLMSYMGGRQFLFLGYGLRDWNLRVVLKNLSGVLTTHAEDELISWAIQYKPTILERILWGKRDITIFDKDISEFIEELSKH